MKTNKVTYNDLNLVRLIACISVLFYHLNILKGGYLAVCTFFILSAYLSCLSAFKKKKFSLKEYYLNLLKKIYLPLIIVVFLTIAILSFIPNALWFNLKAEVNSILFGFNNFWQIGVNLDYFARHISSPFMHLWYISILLQFDLIFPFIFMFLRKIGNKFHKIFPCIILLLATIVSFLYFYKVSKQNNITILYYNTFTRMFPLFLGMLLGFIHNYFDKFYYKNKLVNRSLFYIYNIIMIIIFIFIDSNIKYMCLAMLIISLMTCKLIDYGTIYTKKINSLKGKLVSYLCSISYEIYLVQYPVIYFFQLTKLNFIYKIILTIIITLLLSCILNFSNVLNKKKGFKELRYIFSFLILIVSLFGFYKYIISKNYTKEIKELENKLSKNEELVIQKQNEYIEKNKAEENAWSETLTELKNGEEDLKNVVTNLSIVGIGDSVMLGATPDLYKTFPNGYFDAKISRTAWVVKDIINDLQAKNLLKDVIVFNLGANGDCSKTCKEEIIKLCGDRDIFWVTTTNNIDANQNIIELSKKYNNLHIIDWYNVSRGHEEYFVSDKIHLTGYGSKAYTNAVYDSIYNVYLEKFNIHKQSILDEHEKKELSKITFIGNDILLNAYEFLAKDFNDAKFIMNKEMDYNFIKDSIEKSIEDKTMTHRIVFAFDNNINLSKDELNDLINLYKDYEIYLVSINDLIETYDLDINKIDFYQEVKNNDYLMVDKVHLNEFGNKALSKLLKEKLSS